MSNKRRSKKSQRPGPHDEPEGILEGMVHCGEHGCPMIYVDGSYVCLFEHVDALIGGQQVVDIIRSSADGEVPLSLVFEGGRVLPLLCPCCGGPILLDDAPDMDRILQEATGWYLQALVYHEVEGDQPECLELVLTPDLESDPDTEGSGLCVHLDSARGIR